MAKVQAINLADGFNPPSLNPVALREAVQSGQLDMLASTSGSAIPAIGMPTVQNHRLSTQVKALAASKERGPSGANRRAAAAAAALSLPPPPPNHSEGPLGGQQNARLPPLMHGYSASPSGVRSASPDQKQQLLQQQQLQQQQSSPQQQPPPPPEGAALLPPPAAAQHPYHHKRKPPSAFLRHNPLKQQLELQQVETLHGGAAAGAAAARHNAILEAIAAGGAESFATTSGHAFGGAATAPWGVSSVSDLEALDSILDQLVVVDARMRKALLKGPLISFETIVPEQDGARGAAGHQRHGEDEKDHTFLTSVKGVVEVVSEEAEPASAPPAEPADPGPSGLDERPLERTGTSREGSRAVVLAAGQTTEPDTDPRDSAIFRASIPSTTMHPSFTRAYLSSKASQKPILVPPPPAPTADYLLRSRPPPFIAAPSYEELCGQIRDVQRQYTCGTMRGPAGAAPGGGGGGGGAAAGTMVMALGGAVLPVTNANQYISGLDGPLLDEVVQQHDLPISLERVRPTFVAMTKSKSARRGSPRARRGSRLFASGDEAE